MKLLEGLGKAPTTALVVSTGAFAAVRGIIVGLVVKRIGDGDSSSKDKLPAKWVKVGKIKKLIIHPVKSRVGISVNEAILGRLGLQGTKPK